jgi:hypothetical protein
MVEYPAHAHTIYDLKIQVWRYQLSRCPTSISKRHKIAQGGPDSLTTKVAYAISNETLLKVITRATLGERKGCKTTNHQIYTAIVTS